MTTHPMTHECRSPVDPRGGFAATRYRRSVWVGVASVMALHLALLAPGWGQTLPGSLDLETCRGLVLKHNPSIRLSREYVVEQDGVLIQRHAIRYPHLDAEGVYSVIDDERLEDFVGTDMSDTSWNADIRATLALYTGGTYQPNLQSAELTQSALQHQSVTAQQDVLLAMQERFYGALLARQEIGVQEESVRLLDQQLTLARNRYDAGVGPKFDVLQADVALANERPVLLRARNAYRTQIEQLRRVIGLPYPEGEGPGDVEIAGEWDEDSRIPELEEALAEAEANRPELRDLAMRREAGEKDLLSIRRSLRPQVDAFAGYGALNEQFTDTDDYMHGWITGVQARWPVWDGHDRKGRVLQQGSRLLQIDLQTEDLQLQIGEEVRRHRFDCELAREIRRTSDRVIEQAEEALRLASNRFEAGGAKQLDVLQSQLGLTRARLDQAHADHDFHVARARLMRSLGRLE